MHTCTYYIPKTSQIHKLQHNYFHYVNGSTIYRTFFILKVFLLTSCPSSFLPTFPPSFYNPSSEAIFFPFYFSSSPVLMTFIHYIFLFSIQSPSLLLPSQSNSFVSQSFFSFHLIFYPPPISLPSILPSFLLSTHSLSSFLPKFLPPFSPTFRQMRRMVDKRPLIGTEKRP